MPRQADNLSVTYEALYVDLDGGAGIQAGLQVYHKNSEDVGPGSNASATIIRLTAAGKETKEFLDLKELVRYRFYCVGSNDNASVVFRVLEPVWFDDVLA